MALAVAVPVLGAAFGPTAPQLPPLAAGVLGAVGEPSLAPSFAPSSAPVVTTGGTAEASSAPTPAASGAPAPTGEPADAPLTAATRPTGLGGPFAAIAGAPPVAGLTGYRWPISAGRISLPFKAIPGGEFSKDGKLFHDGVDMASFCGAPVVAAHDGVVLAAGRHFDDEIGWVGDLRPYYRHLDAGNLWNELPIVVVIDDGNGYRSMYAHFRDVTVKPGQRVLAGALIGHEGATGHASGCHVHYGLFSPLETKQFGVRPDIVKRMKVPKHEIARIDPLQVLPGGDVALKTRSIAKAIKAAAAAG